MKKKSLPLLILALASLTLTACSSNQPSQDTKVWSSENIPVDQNAPTEKTETEVQTSSEIQAGTWVLDTDKTIVTWKGSKVVGASHTGTVNVKSGSLEVADTGPKTGEFVMDMTSITESKNDATFLEHMKSDDFFSVKDFPEAKFVLTKITLVSGNEYKVEGDLTIRDITKPITFEATAQYDATEKTLGIKADFTIDRTQWDIKFDSSSFVQNLGDAAIKDEIDFDLDLAFYLKAA